jgi:hypothetical protein
MNHRHVLKFDDSYSTYYSIRVNPGDFDYISGSLIRSDLNIYGDSHPLLLFKGLSIEHRNLFDFGKTMFRVGRDQAIINFRESHNHEDGIFCLAYGEVDIRAHIGKQVQLGRHHVTVCKELVQEYFQAIKKNIVKYKAIIIVAVPPPVDPNDHRHAHNLPFVGTNSDRVIYTRDMNTMLDFACKQAGYHFLNPFDFYMRSDGMLNYDLSDGCIHVGKNEHFQNAFRALYKNIMKA